MTKQAIPSGMTEEYYETMDESIAFLGDSTRLRICQNIGHSVTAD